REKIALLIDGNNSGAQPTFREFLGGLTAQELYEELRKQRYEDDDEAPIVNADRRLIYISNLDAWGILALVGTAPESLSRLLGDFMINYICASPSIGVSFSTEGPETFTMQFSLPFRVWRSNNGLMSDNRQKKPSGEPLRASRNATFLRYLGQCEGLPNHTDGIYATTMSCMVTGYDQWRWTGLVLLETWFDEILDDPSPDMITRYENDFQDGMISDPLCRGKDDATRTEWSPRPYFIRVLEIRIVQIYREWTFLFARLDERLKAITRRHKDLITRARVPAKEPREFQSRQAQILREFDEFERGFSELRDILEELAQDLKETVRSGESFMNTDVRYFINYDESEDASLCIPHLTQIRNTFNILEQLGMRLRDMQQKCRDLMDEAVSARKIYRVQLAPVAPSSHVHLFEPRVLAWITILTQPLIITAAIFGCDDIVTFKRNWQNFIIVMIVITVMLVIIVLFVLRLASGQWLFQTTKTCSDHTEDGRYAGEGTRDNIGREWEQQSAPRRTFFTGLVDRVQVQDIRRTMAGTPSARGQVMELEEANPT
ncbi:hypothetical protein JMJ77_0003432, partial [Colletotrichum scovillei]